MKRWAMLLCALMATSAWAQEAPPPAAPETPPVAEQPPATTTPAPGPVNPLPVTPVVRQEIRVRQLQPIDFGVFVSERGGGGVTVSAMGSRVLSGNISSVGVGGAGAAEFEIIGQPDEMVIIYLPDRVNLGKDSGNGDVVITDLTIAPEGTITLDAQGRARVKVGGTLKLPGNVSPGNYNGMFDLDVRYLR